MRNLIRNLFSLPRYDVVVLFVEYDRGLAGGSEHAFTTLQGYLSQARGCRCRFLRIDNKNEAQELRQEQFVFRLGGDNRYREFSGWQKGVETIDHLGLPCDLVLFVNDMFLAPGESFLKDYARRPLFAAALADNAIIGRIDSTGECYTAHGHDVSSWVCTNCFLAPKKAVDTIGHLATVQDDLDDFLTSTYPGPNLFRADAPLNEAYRQWLGTWLTTHWHSRFVIGPHTWEMFRAKVRNILNEALLTARFRAAGFPPRPYGDRKYY